MMILKRYMSAIYIVYQPRNGSRCGTQKYKDGS